VTLPLANIIIYANFVFFALVDGRQRGRVSVSSGPRFYQETGCLLVESRHFSLNHFLHDAVVYFSVGMNENDCGRQ